MPEMNPVKPIAFFLSLIFSGVIFVGNGLAKPESGVGTTQQWAVVNGFRSAHFGMNERDLIKLRNHFVQKKYQKEGFALNAQMDEGIILVFQGKDRKGRAARLLLSNPKLEGDKKAGENIALTLSYIKKPEYPDVYRIKAGDF